MQEVAEYAAREQKRKEMKEQQAQAYIGAVCAVGLLPPPSTHAIRLIVGCCYFFASGVMCLLTLVGACNSTHKVMLAAGVTTHMLKQAQHKIDT